jgi:hypothetical protein
MMGPSALMVSVVTLSNLSISIIIWGNLHMIAYKES